MAHTITQEDLSSNKALFFDGSKYEFWSVRMEAYLMDLGFDVLEVVTNGYEISKNPSRDWVGKKASENNSMELNDILCGLPKSKFNYCTNYTSCTK